MDIMEQWYEHCDKCFVEMEEDNQMNDSVKVLPTIQKDD